MDFLKLILLVFFACLEIGCGVKGDPVPPSRPPELGHGRPNFKQATEEFAYPRIPPVQRQDSDSQGARE